MRVFLEVRREERPVRRDEASVLVGRKRIVDLDLHAERVGPLAAHARALDPRERLHRFSDALKIDREPVAACALLDGFAKPRERDLRGVALHLERRDAEMVEPLELAPAPKERGRRAEDAERAHPEAGSAPEGTRRRRARRACVRIERNLIKRLNARPVFFSRGAASALSGLVRHDGPLSRGRRDAAPACRARRSRHPPRGRPSARASAASCRARC